MRAMHDGIASHGAVIGNKRRKERSKARNRRSYNAVEEVDLRQNCDVSSNKGWIGGGNLLLDVSQAHDRNQDQAVGWLSTAVA